MDRGLENAVKISLFTKRGWWGNTLTTEESKKIGSDVEESVKKTITLSAIADMEVSVKQALDWMRKKGIANAEVEITNPAGNQTEMVVSIQPPGQDVQELRLSTNGENWREQAVNPANKMR
jgi:phage gp46-like protein